MAELIILIIGALITGFLALLKLASVIAWGWFGVFVPLMVAVFIVFCIWGGDVIDFDFD